MNYPGGKSKSGVFQTIINQIPPHSLYVEAFFGGGAIMRLKRPAPASIGIDSDARALTSSDWHGKIPGLELVEANAVEWLASHSFSGDTFVYLDPPYLMSTRSSQRRIYQHEFCTVEDHAELLAVINRLTCMVAISGYWSELYADELREWRSISFQTQTRGGRLATEWLWMNYPEPLELHDYRYLGCNYRQREKLKRRFVRWKARLLRMESLERHAMMMAIDEVRSLTSLETAMRSRTAENDETAVPAQMAVLT